MPFSCFQSNFSDRATWKHWMSHTEEMPSLAKDWHRAPTTTTTKKNRTHHKICILLWILAMVSPSILLCIISYVYTKWSPAQWRCVMFLRQYFMWLCQTPCPYSTVAVWLCHGGSMAHARCSFALDQLFPLV